MNTIPLRYHISDWHQLANVKSNNSRKLSIHIADLCQSDKLTGLRISIYHEDYGNLFTYILNANGQLLSDCNGLRYGLSGNQILHELEKYGFLVTYSPAKRLCGDQITYLMNLKSLKFDKLRILSVWHIEDSVKVFNHYIVAFNIKCNESWLNNGYAASENQFGDALKSGSAVNITDISHINSWDWTWLDYVADIDDILRDNS